SKILVRRSPPVICSLRCIRRLASRLSSGDSLQYLMLGPQSGVSTPKLINFCLSICVMPFLLLSTFKHDTLPHSAAACNKNGNIYLVRWFVRFFMDPYAMPNFKPRKARQFQRVVNLFFRFESQFSLKQFSMNPLLSDSHERSQTD